MQIRRKICQLAIGATVLSLYAAAGDADAATFAEGEKSGQAYITEAVNRNRPGTKAADFAYVSRDGKTTTLYRTRAARLVLFFFDPTCRHCLDIMDSMSLDTTLRHMSENGKLSILAVYADGDPDLWKKACGMIPCDWQAGFECGEINGRDLYIFTEMPAVYLLDRRKRVVLKDASIEEIVSALTER